MSHEELVALVNTTGAQLSQLVECIEMVTANLKTMNLRIKDLEDAARLKHPLEQFLPTC